MATMKPKITRLGDPANPYTKKKVSAAQAQASARALGVKARKPDAEAPKKKKKTGDSPTGILGRARMRAVDDRIKKATGEK